MFQMHYLHRRERRNDLLKINNNETWHTAGGGGAAVDQKMLPRHVGKLQSAALNTAYAISQNWDPPNNMWW
jgi:hypothetical protein